VQADEVDACLNAVAERVAAADCGRQFAADCQFIQRQVATTDRRLKVIMLTSRGTRARARLVQALTVMMLICEYAHYT
jgi:hypothetical protein